jgi:hypothetical protein
MEREILGAVESGSGSDWTSAVRESASTRGGEAAGKKGSCGPATHTFGSSGGSGLMSSGLQGWHRVLVTGLGPRLFSGHDGCSVQGSGEAALWLRTAIVAWSLRPLDWRSAAQIHGNPWRSWNPELAGFRSWGAAAAVSRSI